MNFSKKQAQRLEELLNQEKYPEVLNYQECHGFLCALAAGALNLDPSTLSQVIFYGVEPCDKTLEIEAIQLIELLYQEIQNTLFSAETLLLPCSLQINSDISESLADWSLGFFEALMINEESWYEADESITAEMLLPFLLCLEEIDDDEIISVKKNAELFQTLILQIPQALQDLYLYFHVNDA